MTAAEARYIVNHPEQYSDIGSMGWSQVHEAKGFLKCLELMGPVVEALERIKIRCIEDCGDFADPALKHYRRKVLGENADEGNGLGEKE